MSTAGVVIAGTVVAATVVVVALVVVEADVVEVVVDVEVDPVRVVADGVIVANVDATSVACPVVEQATISSRDPTPNRIGIP